MANPAELTMDSPGKWDDGTRIAIVLYAQTAGDADLGTLSADAIVSYFISPICFRLSHKVSSSFSTDRHMTFLAMLDGC